MTAPTVCWLVAVFEQRILELHGERGRAWLTSLPAQVIECEERWQLSVGLPFPDLSYHWVAPATTRDGTSRVLKLGVPGREVITEIDALRAWAGHGTVRLIEADPAAGALLLERLVPGVPLAALGLARDDEATAVAANLMRQLHSAAPPEGLPTLAEWTNGIVRAVEADFAPSLTDLASRLRDELLASAPLPSFLHADLHHFNILSDDRQPWLAIDPKGVVGDPAYEPAPFLYNPIDAILAAPDAERIVARRIAHFSQQFDRARVVDWAFVQAVLSAWWSFEDEGHGHEPALRFAELIARLR